MYDYPIQIDHYRTNYSGNSKECTIDIKGIGKVVLVRNQDGVVVKEGEIPASIYDRVIFFAKNYYLGSDP